MRRDAPTRVASGGPFPLAGLLGAELLFAVIYCLGRAIAPFTLRHLPEEARRQAMAEFSSRCLARFLLMLFLVYPGVPP